MPFSMCKEPVNSALRSITASSPENSGLKLTSMRLNRSLALNGCLMCMAATLPHAQIRVLIIDGINNHDSVGGNGWHSLHS